MRRGLCLNLLAAFWPGCKLLDGKCYKNVVSWILLLWAIFRLFLSLLQRQTKFIKCGTKIKIKQAKFWSSWYTSLLLRRKPIEQNLLHFFKIYIKKVLAVRVNEIKVTLRNVFINTFFALESEKEWKTDERTIFLDYLRILYQAVNR